MELIYPEFYDRFAAFLRSLEGRRVVVISHARPDGDCIGSQVALTRVLRALNIDVICANPDPVPRRIQFAVGDTPLVNFDGLPEGDLTAIYVDCADQGRAGEKLKARFPAPFANIDHHLSNIGFAQHNFIDVGSAATAEILAGLFLDHHLPIDAQAAQSLYAGIATDTGQFRFNSTSRRTFLIVAELMARGAQPAAAAAELYERETAGKLDLLQRFLASLSYECAGRVCIGTLPNGIYAATGTSPEDVEGLVDYARSIEGVEIGVLIEEQGTAIKASLRSKDPVYRVDRIAAAFNGGGHACAAGLNLRDVTMADFRSRLVAAIDTQISAVDTLKKSTL
ncbi:DHH family phosphoesterase [Rariglobus hedericola]|uniref:Bifunctional oligoribonuclease/PAP phosphatase NrnA n=1 Tax=Rariglobus hedericola TaxID=2597822 RepID=A0A556QP47_9BACT|nr:bifunctional oligoribonuclease/PAP phosphatase NrnA [Rariglobus hedericola]TSJ78399.1 bifunctional oligoribonuclease/PAP phosphatase NrnA [Rariglobus hedericola]